MSSKKKKWLLGLGLAGLAGFVTIFLVGRHMSRRFEPYIKEQAIEYLKKRFDSEVELLQDLTSSRKLLQKALDQLKTPDSGQGGGRRYPQGGGSGAQGR